MKPMRKIQLLLLMLFCTLSAVAQTNGAYYRVQNKKTSRYISVIDNRGSIDLSTTEADLGALQTVKGEAYHLSDPSTIVKFEKMSANGWNLKSQGTGTYTIIEHQVQIAQTPNGYMAYAQSGSAIKYLVDTYKLSNQNAPISTLKTGTGDERYWNLLLVGTTDDSYFGLEPTVSAGGSYYQTFYAGFPFTFYSSGMEAYYVKTIDNAKSAVVIEPISGGVTAETPVLIKCSSNQATDNRLNIGSGTGSASGNKLTGVYFCNDVPQTTLYNHRNVVDYDASTMRVLGTAADGSLAFVKSSDLQYIPANTAYITVDAGAPDELKVYTQSEYDALPTAKRGDLNEDGIVDGLDLVIMVNMILEQRAKTTAADLDANGDVDGVDYVKLVNIILGRN